MEKNIIKFEVGNKYSMTSVCDANCVWTYKIERRTAKSVWMIIDGKLVRRSIGIYNGEEQVMPLGCYSMAPILGAKSKNIK